MESWKHIIRGSLTLAGIVTAIVLATDVLTVVSAPIARAAGLTPREIAITDDEAGRQAARAVDKDGEDGRPVWVQLRWERDQESASRPASAPATPAGRSTSTSAWCHGSRTW